MILRHFLYLNTSMMTDYLSQLEGSVATETLDQIETKKSDKGGKIAAKVLEGGLTREISAEVKQQRVITDAAKFQRLHELLEDQNALQALNAFDNGIWDQIRRGELLEMEATIAIPRWLTFSEMIGDVKPLLDFMDVFGEGQTDPEVRDKLKGWTATIGDYLAKKPIPLLFHATLTHGFHFAAALQRKHLCCELSDLQGEATVVGKVQRILSSRQKTEVFSLVPSMDARLSSIKDRNERARKKREALERGYVEVLKGPGAILAPLAVFL